MKSIYVFITFLLFLNLIHTQQSNFQYTVEQLNHHIETPTPLNNKQSHQQPKQQNRGNRENNNHQQKQTVKQIPRNDTPAKQQIHNDKQNIEKKDIVIEHSIKKNSKQQIKNTKNQIKIDKEQNNKTADKSIRKQDSLQIIQKQQKIDQQQLIQKQKYEQMIQTLNPEQVIEQQSIENQEVQMQKQQQKQLNDKLPQWIQKQKQQIHNTQYFNGSLEHASFIINQQFIESFQIDLRKKKRNQTFYFQISVYVEENQRFIIPNSTAESQFLGLLITQQRVTSKNMNKIRYLQQKKIYLGGKFHLSPSRSGIIYLNFINKYNKLLFIQFSQQMLTRQLQSIAHSQVDPHATRLSNIIKQIKQQGQKRKYSYKWQWGFKQKQDDHQSNMLALTGIELIALIVTGLIQMCCIKNLLDNTSIV